MELQIKDFFSKHRAEALAEMKDALEREIKCGNNPDYNSALEKACKALNRVLKFLQPKDKEVWYRAVFAGGEDEYHCFTLNSQTTMKKLDQQAIKWAKECAKEDELDLVEVAQVDGKKECFPEIRTIWW